MFSLIIFEFNTTQKQFFEFGEMIRNKLKIKEDCGRFFGQN